MARSNPVRSPVSSKLLIALFSLSCIIASPYALAEEEPDLCVTGNQQECDFESENLSLFIKGRDAYDRGREIGDLTEARTIGMQLTARKTKKGRVLLKMIYMQVRMGGHKNTLQAYEWVEESIANNEGYPRLDMHALLEKLKEKLTPEELAKLNARSAK